MNYTKKPLSVQEQIELLQSRGLQFSDIDFAKHYLSNTSYYRLRAYTYPFQNNDIGANHEFVSKIDFQDIVAICDFDEQLRNIIFKALGKIEIAIRCKLSLIYSVSLDNGVWYTLNEVYNNKAVEYNKVRYLLNDIEDDVDRSIEDFIKHYKRKYDYPQMPPSWMSLEVVSMGLLSRLYNMLKKDTLRKQVAMDFGVNNDDVFANWLHALSNLRNCCAHHSRIWNRRFVVSVIMSYNTKLPFISKSDSKHVRPNKLFALLSIIKYLMDYINPNNEFSDNLLTLLQNRHRLISLKEIGFPTDWKMYPIWKNLNI